MVLTVFVVIIVYSIHTKGGKSISVVEAYTQAVADCVLQTDLPWPCALKPHADIAMNTRCVFIQDVSVNVSLFVLGPITRTSTRSTYCLSSSPPWFPLEIADARVRASEHSMKVNTSPSCFTTSVNDCRPWCKQKHKGRYFLFSYDISLVWRDWPVITAIQRQISRLSMTGS